jgi:flagellar basal body rod protein FlgC
MSTVLDVAAAGLAATDRAMELSARKVANATGRHSAEIERQVVPQAIATIVYNAQLTVIRVGEATAQSLIEITA